MIDFKANFTSGIQEDFEAVSLNEAISIAIMLGRTRSVFVDSVEQEIDGEKVETVIYDEKHVWVSEYLTCDSCNYSDHRCYFCGADLDHDGFDSNKYNHSVSFCRPDLDNHRVGSLCTWPSTNDKELDKELNRPNCYWDHVNNKLKD